MERRKFLQNSSILGCSLLVSPRLMTAENQTANHLKQGENEITNRVRKAMLSMQRASWEHGVAMQALLELGDEEMVVLMAKEAVLRQTGEGRLSVVYVDNGVTDPAASGEGVLYAYKITGEQTLKEGAENMLNYLLTKAPRSKEGTIYHTLDAPEIWVDSMYMAPPFLAAAGEYDESLKLIDGIKSRLWNSNDQLFSHRWSDKLNDYVNKSYWGVGNGWAASGMCRVINLLPKEMYDEKKKLIDNVIQVLEGCLKYIRSDYLFHNVVDDPDSFIETNLSQMLAYTIFRGIARGWLSDKYLDYALQMRKAAHQKVDANGYVKDVCGAPEFESPGRATEGQAFFLLMEAAFADLMNVKEF